MPGNPSPSTGVMVMTVYFMFLESKGTKIHYKIGSNANAKNLLFAISRIGRVVLTNQGGGPRQKKKKKKQETTDM